MVLEAKNLTKHYGDVQALDQFSFEVGYGEAVGLLGPNGSGKTTAISIILGLLSSDRGDVTIFGQEMKPDSYTLKRRIGLVPQDLAIFSRLTVKENIEFFASLYLNDANERAEGVRYALEFTGLENYANRRTSKLSGGLMRRLNVACGIAHRPDLLFLDEPTVAVDAQSRLFMRQGFEKLRDEGTSLVYTSHYLDEVEALCDRIVIMDHGRNLAQGSLTDLKNMVSLQEIVHLEVDEETPELKRDLEALAGLYGIESNQSGWRLSFRQGNNNILKIMEILEKHETSYRRLFSEESSLNDVFLELTGKELRDS